MATKPAPKTEIAQLIVDGTACASALFDTISKSNQVMLAASNALIERALQTVKELHDLKKNDAGPAVGELKNELLTTLSQQREAGRDALARASAQLQNATPEDDLAAAFVNCINLVMENAVSTQQSLFSLALTATGKNIAVILNAELNDLLPGREKRS